MTTDPVLHGPRRDHHTMIVAAETLRDDQVLWAHTLDRAYSYFPGDGRRNLEAGPITVWLDEDVDVDEEVPPNVRQALESWAQVRAAEFDDRPNHPYFGAPGATKFIDTIDDCSQALAHMVSPGAGPDNIDHRLDLAQADVVRQIIDRLTALIPTEDTTS